MLLGWSIAQRLSVLEGEVELLFLVEVEPEDGVDAAEGATKIAEVCGLGAGLGKVVDLSLEHVDQMGISS